MIPPEELLIEAWPPRGGGQQVGTGPAGVRITHVPTGIQAFCDTCGSPHRNRLVAMEMIEAALTSPHFR